MSVIIFGIVGIALAGCLIYGIIDNKKNTEKKEAGK